jgi:hypothetical protein
LGLHPSIETRDKKEKNYSVRKKYKGLVKKIGSFCFKKGPIDKWESKAKNGYQIHKKSQGIFLKIIGSVWPLI